MKHSTQLNGQGTSDAIRAYVAATLEADRTSAPAPGLEAFGLDSAEMARHASSELSRARHNASSGYVSSKKASR